MAPLLDEPSDATADIPDGYELIDGELVERGMGSSSSWVGGEIYALLRDFGRANRVGWAWPADAGYRCFPHKPGMVRFPDASFIRLGRLPGEQFPEGHTEIPPDLAVEVVSPKDRAEVLMEKLLDYRAAGVRLVWVIYPAAGIAHVYRPDRVISEVAADEFLTGEDIVPGFRVRLADLFPPPAPAQA